MSNIHTFGDANKKPQQNQNNDDPNPFKGVARTIDGKVIQPPKEKKKKAKTPTPYVASNPYDDNPNQIEEFIEMPRYLNTQFWSKNVPNQEMMSCKNLILGSCCPCFIGPCCSENRKSDWIHSILSFTFVLLIVQLVMYIISLAKSEKITGILTPSPTALLALGCFSIYEVRVNKQIWRMLSYMFLHGNLLHILFNSLSQITFCLGVEKSWGLARYLVIYVAGGIVGAMFSAFTSLEKGGLASHGSSVGASCAIMAEMGCFLALIIIYWPTMISVMKRGIFMWVIVFICMFIAVGFLPNVDMLGHLGGGIIGFSVGLFMFANEALPQYKNIFIIVGISLTVIAVIVPLFLLIFY